MARILKGQAHDLTGATSEISNIVVECQSQPVRSTLWYHCRALASHLPFVSLSNHLNPWVIALVTLAPSSWSSSNESEHVTSAHNLLVPSVMAAILTYLGTQNTE